MVCSLVRLEAAILRFMYMCIYLTNHFTGKTGRPREMGHDSAILYKGAQARLCKFNNAKCSYQGQNY